MEINSLKNMQQTHIKTDLFLEFRSATRLIISPRKTFFFQQRNICIFFGCRTYPLPHSLCCAKASYEDMV